MKNAKYLDTEEQNLIEEIHEAGYEPVADMDAAIAAFGDLVEKNVNKKKAINIRLLESDLEKIKAKAICEGVGYQTLIGSIIHKFANDRLAG